MENAYHSLFRTHTNGNDTNDNEIVEMIVEKRTKRVLEGHHLAKDRARQLHADSFVQRWTL